jgi:hypothetical protein
VPRWTRWLAAAWLAYAGLALFLPTWHFPTSFGRGLAAEDIVPIGLAAIFLVAGVMAQLWRYWRVSSPAERQRTRWVVFGFAIFMACFLAGVGTLTYVSMAPVGLSHALARLAGPTFILAGFQALAASIAIAVVRHRLWDIDVIIRRTLVYSILTGLLALAYFSSVLLLESVFRLLTGQGRSSLVSVLSTLAIAALFVPLRRRLQDAIDRRFFRRKYDAAQTLAAFGASARGETDLERLAAGLVARVEETMQPESVSLWLRGGDGPGHGGITRK